MNRRSVFFALVLLMMSVFWCNPVLANTLTFDELPFQPVNGLTYQGIAFGFKVGGADSTDANYNDSGPGVITYIQDPSLEGDANGTLFLDFLAPTNGLEFGVSLSSPNSLTPGFTVELFGDDDVTSLGVFAINTAPLLGTYSEGSFHSNYLIGKSIVNFTSDYYGRFALDNLTYSPNVVPEPASMSLFGIGLLGFLFRKRKFK